MARTFLRQSVQIAGSETINDGLIPGAGLEGQESIEGDLNALRSMVKNMSGEGHWYDGVSGRSLKSVDADLTAAESDIAALQSDLATEEARALAAEGVLQGNIDAEATTRAAEDATLQSNIDAEETARISAVSAEETARVAADGVLQSNIDAEATTRAAEDSTLQSNITSEALTRASADSTLQSNIDAEETRALAAESGLQSDIDAEETRALAAEGVLQGNIDAEATTRASADSALDVRVTANEGDIVNLWIDVNALNSDVIYADGRRPFSAEQSMGGFALTNVADPSNAQDAATKAYVDALAVGLTIKAPVKAADHLAAGDVLPSAAAPVMVDGVQMYAGDRAFFFKPGAAAVDAGIYVLEEVKIGGVSTFSWARASDYALGSVSSTFFFVQQGSTYGDTSWVETADPAVVGMNGLEFVQMFGLGTYTAGAGLDLTGREFSIEPGGVLGSMIGAGEVGASNLASSSVETAKIADLAVTNAKIADGTIQEAKLAFAVYTESEIDTQMATKLSRDGSLKMLGALDMNYNQINLLAEPTANADAATKYYVDQAVAGLDSRASKTFAEVTSIVLAGFPVHGGAGGALDAALPVMPSDAAVLSSTFDIFLNGQLLRSGSSNDVSRDATNNQALVLPFDVAVGDVFCVVSYT